MELTLRSDLNIPIFLVFFRFSKNASHCLFRSVQDDSVKSGSPLI